MSERYAFTFAGNGSYANRGCEAIVRGTTALLRHEFGECTFSSIYTVEAFTDPDARRETDPAITHHPLLLIWRFNRLWWRRQFLRPFSSNPDWIVTFGPFHKTIGQIVDCNAILMLGGDNYAHVRPRTAFEFLRLARETGKPIALWGASIGPFADDPDYVAWAAGQLRDVALICARETVTIDYLQSIGVSDNVRYVADPAFLLQPVEPDALHPSIAGILDDGCLGLNLSPLIGAYYQDQSVWRARVVSVIERLLESHTGPILLIPHVTSVIGDPNRDDFLFMADAMRSISNDHGRLFILEPDLNAAQTKWVISRLRLFVGARTHSTLASISSGIPTILVQYSNKARGTAKDVYGHTEWLIDGRDLDPLKLMSMVNDLKRDESSVRQHIEQVLPEFKARARQAATYLHQAL